MTPQIKEFLQRWVICTLAVLVTAHLVHGISYDKWTSLLVATLVLGLLNSFLRPLLLLLSLPLLVISLGLFTLVINAGLLYLVGRLVTGFHVTGFWPAFWGALVVSVVTIMLNLMTGAGNSKVSVRRRGRPTPPSGPPPGQGPIIDV
jgi:putative membrane protein